jgi:hypothetical protein
MPELGPYGSVRGARGNSRPYRDSHRRTVKVARLNPKRRVVVRERRRDLESASVSPLRLRLN